VEATAHKLRTDHNPRSQSWLTPQWIVDGVKYTLGEVDLDPCANEWSNIAKTNIRLPIDGLSNGLWDGTFYCNPPYNKDKQRETSIKTWITRATTSYLAHRKPGILCIPVATDTVAWQDWIFPFAKAIYFPQGRIKFLLPPEVEGGSPKLMGSPRTNTCLVLYGETGALDRFRQYFANVSERKGVVVEL